MSILSELNSLLDGLGIPAETGVFSAAAPDEYAVVTPLADIYEVHADNHPCFEVQEARLSLFSKKNYIRRKNRIAAALLAAGFTITDRRYIGYENDTDFHHYAIDVAKAYLVKED